MTQVRWMVAAIAAVLAAGAAYASPTVPEPPPPPAHALTAADVEAFLDGMVPAAMAQGNIAGTAVAIVKDGEVVLLKGYGLADRAHHVPVDADRTVFRVGSVSKLFTGAVVAQLAAQGKLDLDADINTYLDFPIRPAFGKPITLRNLVTHSAGFEDTSKSTYALNPSGHLPLGAYLAAHQPKRIFPPGRNTAYSNYGVALAGYIVQRVTSVPYERYVSDHLLAPLGMRRSTFAQPPPAIPGTARAFGYRGASSDALPFEYINVAPAGSLSTTASDMSRFLLWQLQPGTMAGAGLDPRGVAIEQTRQFSRGPGVGGVAVNWVETPIDGHRVLAHGGATLQFLAYVAIVPDEHFGFFIVQNSGDHREFLSVVTKALIDRYFTTSPRWQPDRRVLRDDSRILGSYQTLRYNQSSVLQLFGVLQQRRVSRVAPGVISIGGFDDDGGEPLRWARVGPLLYRQIGGTDHVAFVIEANGKTTRLVGPTLFAGDFEKVAFWRTQAFSLVAIGSIAIVLLYLVITCLRDTIGRRLSELDRGERWRRVMVALAALADMTVIVGWPIVLIGGRLHIERLTSALDPTLRLFQLLALCGAAGGVVALVAAFRPAMRRRLRLHYALATAALLGFTLFAIGWNVICASLDY